MNHNCGDNEMEERCVILGRYLVEHSSTVRACACAYGISKSTVHKDLSVRLEHICPALYREVAAVLRKNKEERHIRGGNATKIKYELKRERAPSIR